MQLSRCILMGYLRKPKNVVWDFTRYRSERFTENAIQSRILLNCINRVITTYNRYEHKEANRDEPSCDTNKQLHRTHDEKAQCTY